MTNATAQIRTMTLDLDNPKFDGRKKYGFGSIPTLKAGTVFKLTPSYRFDVEGKTVTQPAYIEIDGTIEMLDFKCEVLVKGFSEEAEANTWAALKMKHGAYTGMADELLELALQIGHITLEDAESLMMVLMGTAVGEQAEEEAPAAEAAPAEEEAPAAVVEEAQQVIEAAKATPGTEEAAVDAAIAAAAAAAAKPARKRLTTSKA